MAYYGQIQSMKGAAIGTIVLWTGGLTGVPDGWLICDGGTRSASDFPLLAQVIGDRYTPELVIWSQLVLILFQIMAVLFLCQD